MQWQIEKRTRDINQGERCKSYVGKRERNKQRDKIATIEIERERERERKGWEG